MSDIADKRSSRPSAPAGEDIFQIVETALDNLWTVVDELARIKPPAVGRPRVTIFGSARIQQQSPIYDDVRRLAKALAELGCDIVTGGGPGLMKAANEGAQIGDPDNQITSYGLRVWLPFEQETNAFVEKAYIHRTFFTRLHHFVRLSNAFVVVEGGIGTTLETMMIWQLLQVHAADVPLVLVGPMWKDLVAWARRNMLRAPGALASEGDLSIPICVDTAEEALAVLKSRFQNL
jgi:uncharacterized protein (TIGR00730 family)